MSGPRLLLAGAGALALIALSACAAPMGEAAGTAIGGGAWTAMKVGKFAGKATVKTVVVAGRTAKGAAVGVHDEFSNKHHGRKDEEPRPASNDEPQPAGGTTQVSQAESTALPY